MARFAYACLAAALFVASDIASAGFKAEVVAPIPERIAIGEITIGATLAEKTAEYGERDIERLLTRVRSRLERELRAVDRLAEPAEAGALLHVVLEDARPNRPTPQQMSSGPRALDIRSFSIGGADLKAVLVADSDGLARFDYSWETPTASDSRYAVTWTDADRTIGRFAARVAAALVE
jgi:hypothetical protein